MDGIVLMYYKYIPIIHDLNYLLICVNFFYKMCRIYDNMYILKDVN